MLNKIHPIHAALFFFCFAFLLTSPFLLRTSHACPPPPDPPTLTGLEALFPSAQRLTWSQSYGASEYRIYRSTNGSSFSYLQTGSGTTADIGGLSAGTRYWYRVTAWNSSGESGYSNTLDGWTKPEAPVLVSITPLSTSSILLQSNTPAGAVSGIVLRAPVVNGVVGSYQVVAQGIAFPSYEDTGLAAGSKYSYKAIAVNGGGGQSAESNALAAWTLPSVALSVQVSAVEILGYADTRVISAMGSPSVHGSSYSWSTPDDSDILAKSN